MPPWLVKATEKDADVQAQTATGGVHCIGSIGVLHMLTFKPILVVQARGLRRGSILGRGICSGARLRSRVRIG